MSIYQQPLDCYRNFILIIDIALIPVREMTFMLSRWVHWRYEYVYQLFMTLPKTRYLTFLLVTFLVENRPSTSYGADQCPVWRSKTSDTALQGLFELRIHHAYYISCRIVT